MPSVKSPPLMLALLLACGGKSEVHTAATPDVTPCGPAVLSTPGAGPAQFETFLSEYVKAPVDSRDELLARFIAEQQHRGGFPIIGSDGTVVFFYVATASESDVRIIGDFRAKNYFDITWDDKGSPLAKAIDGGSVWFVRMRFETDARFDYQVLIDGKGRQDPLNARTVESGWGGPSSELLMPAARLPNLRGDVPHGVLSNVEETWASPKVTVYLPPGYDSRRRYPVIYTADGTAWRELVRLPAILDDLIARGAIEPAIAVMIDAAEDRTVWYFWNPAYLEYLDKVVKYIDQRYATRAEPAGRIHVGTSAGARASFQVAIDRSSMFGKIAMLSPSLRGVPHIYEPLFSGRQRLPSSLRVWLSSGTYEGAICEDTRVMSRWFRESGNATKTAYVHEVHSFGNWRRVAIDALIFLLAR